MAIMRDEHRSASARVNAARKLLYWGYGPPSNHPIERKLLQSYFRSEEAGNAGDLGIGYVRGRRLLGRRINIPCVRFDQPG